MNEFLILTKLTSGDKYIVPLRKVAAIQGTAAGSDIYVEGLNAWAQVKETPDEIADLLRSLVEW